MNFTKKQIKQTVTNNGETVVLTKSSNPWGKSYYAVASSNDRAETFTSVQLKKAEAVYKIYSEIY